VSAARPQTRTRCLVIRFRVPRESIPCKFRLDTICRGNQSLRVGYYNIFVASRRDDDDDDDDDDLLHIILTAADITFSINIINWFAAVVFIGVN